MTEEKTGIFCCKLKCTIFVAVTTYKSSPINFMLIRLNGSFVINALLTYSAPPGPD